MNPSRILLRYRLAMIHANIILTIAIICIMLSFYYIVYWEFNYLLISVSCSMILLFLSKVLKTNEYDFASKYDMTHLLDIDSDEERFIAYKEHLSEWINSVNEEGNPKRERGVDPAGPDWGKTDFKLGHEPQRRDAIIEGEKYDGMEGELTSSEKMVATANEKYADMAQKRWDKSEANDGDLVEYGVDRLGDLVKTEYFEKNAEEGVFAKTANKNEELP